MEGEFKVLEQNKKIVQSWRLGGWPKGKSQLHRLSLILMLCFASPSPEHWFPMYQPS